MTGSLAHYFVTDIETDGPDAGGNSMLSFATVAVREDGVMAGEFEAVLQPRADRKSNERTMAWWQTQPDAWAAATTDPEPADIVMPRFAEWVESFPGKRSFAARPVTFDGIWIDRYLRDFAGSYLLDIPYWGPPGDRNIFTAGALDIGNYLSGVFNRTDPQTVDVKFPPDWLGDHEHSHRAIDDARGYANLLARLFQIAKRQPPHPDDFIGSNKD